MASEDDTRKRLAMGIVEYLDKAVAEDLVTSDGAESLEIAKQCISDAFGLDLDNAAQAKELSLKPHSLDKVFDVYMATQAKLGSEQSADKSRGPSEDDKKKADEFKAEGNRLVMQKDYAGAAAAYSKAIDLVTDNAVYYGNRAAAYSQSGEHEKAVADATRALEIDSSYGKGYSRLGLAYFGLGKFAEAAEAYEKGLALDPNNKVMQASLESAKAKMAASTDRAASPPASGAQENAGPGGGGAGGLDLGSLMNNPAMMSMAQNMMANGGLERLMSNPAISRMAESYRNGGQAPNMSDLMSNPDIMNMARSFAGSSAGSGGSEGTADTSNAGAAANPLADLMNNPALADMAQRFMGGGNNSNNSNSNSGSGTGSGTGN
ncbi:Small glutamine-rich tetratricopeptide repeat-containing protein 2 [Coemansia sp. RSA 552]|nr:Small glutamine-rich tetratricopeptide repeat-containing protein 2 [Coemansia sp. RSA 552]